MGLVTNIRKLSSRTADTHRPWHAADDRYEHFDYRQVGSSGLYLPPISLGLWWNYGDNRPFDQQRAVLRHAFDLGITHFDLANNYGPPYGSAEENFGRMLRGDFRPYRDELIVSSKAGWDMWRGPYGDYGSRKYLTASIDASLERLGLDYVDLFYSHRADPTTPVEETIAALDSIVRAGKALYVGISSYSPERTEHAVRVARELGTPLVIHQPSYSLLNRWVEDGLLDVLRREGLGSIAFTPLAQGLLTNKYLGGRDAKPSGGRPAPTDAQLTGENLDRLQRLADFAGRRGQTLAQLAIAWLLREGGVSSVLIGASRVEQLDENVKAVEHIDFTDDELREIDSIVGHGDPSVNWWAGSAAID